MRTMTLNREKSTLEICFKLNVISLVWKFQVGCEVYFLIIVKRCKWNL